MNHVGKVVLLYLNQSHVFNCWKLFFNSFGGSTEPIKPYCLKAHFSGCLNPSKSFLGSWSESQVAVQFNLYWLFLWCFSPAFKLAVCVFTVLSRAQSGSGVSRAAELFPIGVSNGCESSVIIWPLVHRDLFQGGKQQRLWLIIFVFLATYKLKWILHALWEGQWIFEI